MLLLHRQWNGRLKGELKLLIKKTTIMILGFKEKFVDGKPTLFEEKIIAAIEEFGPNWMVLPKIHSMRSGERWIAGMQIQMAYGVRTKHYRQFNKGIAELSTCISTQRVFMSYEHQLEIVVDDRDLLPDEISMLIQNDGLTYLQFINWFFPKDQFIWEGQIIHWTKFRY